MIADFITPLYSTAENFSINPNIFVALYLITFLPCWWLVVLMVRSVIKRQFKHLMIYAILETFFLLLPYLYLISVARGVSVIYYVIIGIVILFTMISSYVSINKKINNKIRGA
jgi:hypothetical protein